MHGRIQTYLIARKKINDLMNMDDIKMFAKNENGWETLMLAVMIYSDDIGMEIGDRKMCHANNKKRKMANDGRKRTTKSRKNQNARRKNYKYLRILEADTIK